MKTFNEILTTPNFSANVLTNNYCSKKSLNFILKSYHLQPLLKIIPINMHKYIFSIMPSKKNSHEILIGFNNYPICVEFNKFHAKRIAGMIRGDTLMARQLQLQEYQKITGWMPKSNLYLFSIQTIHRQEMLYEKSRGHFINHAVNQKIYDCFEDIRSIITLRHKHIANLEQQDTHSAMSTYYICDTPHIKQ